MTTETNAATVRVTKAALAGRFANVTALAQSAGIAEAKDWTLYRGSPVHAIVTVDPDTGGHRTVIACVGTTAREAYDYLGAMREAYLLFDRRSVA